MYQSACHTISEVYTTGWRKKNAFCDNLQHDDLKRPSFSFWQRRRNTKVNRSIAIFPSSEFKPIYIRSQQAEIIAKPRTWIFRCRLLHALLWTSTNHFNSCYGGEGGGRACLNLCRNATQARTEKKHTHVAPQALPSLAWSLQRNARDIRASRVTPVLWRLRKFPRHNRITAILGSKWRSHLPFS